MPRHKQPRPLLTLCVSAVAKRIVAQSESLFGESPDGTMPANLEFAREEYVTSLPGTVRAMMLEEIGRLLPLPPPSFSITRTPHQRLCMLSHFTRVMLLTPDIQDLCLQLCCIGCNHQEALLSLLAQEGAGLKSLRITLPDLTLKPAPLQQALVRSVNLKHLYIPNNCRDAYLKIIGSSCPNLSLLDVSGSKYVTDIGLRLLFLREEDLFMEDVAVPGNTTLCLDPSCRASNCTLIRLLLNIFVVMQYFGERDDVADRLHFILHCWKQETKLCGSLRVLDIGNTSVTPRGSVLALMKAPLLRSFGRYTEILSAVEVFDSCWRHVHHSSLTGLPTFGLQWVSTPHIREAQLVLLRKYFPKLKLLEIHSPQFNPPALALLPPMLKVLRISNFNFSGLWAAELYSLRNKPQGRHLISLSLSSSLQEGTELNLHEVLQSCPNLRIFKGIGMHIHWMQGMSGREMSFPNLCFLTLGQVVSKEVVIEALRRCPNLQVTHFHQCPDLTDGDIKKAINPPLKHLKCFFVGHAPRLTVQTVLAMQSAHVNLRSIGDITHWDISEEAVFRIRRDILDKNWDLIVTESSHWFSFFCEM